MIYADQTITKLVRMLQPRANGSNGSQTEDRGLFACLAPIILRPALR